MAVTQADRTVEITTPLGTDVLVLRSMSGTERVGQLFEYQLELLSERDDIAIADILGQNVTIRLNAAELTQEPRFFNGFITRFTYLGTSSGLAWYRASLRPWLWFLTRRADCRIFQEMTVPDIIKQVFSDAGFSDVDLKLSGSYPPWDYCVQYRETDFNFVSRLMEQEGIYYFFQHERDKHKLVLADAYSAHETVANYETVPFYPPDSAGRRERDHVSRWTHSGQVKPGAYALTDYDFEAPTKNLMSTLSNPADHAHNEYEMYDYPGEYTENSDGDTYTRTRLEELQAQHQWCRGEGNARGLAAGALFTLKGHPRSDQDKEYLLLATTINLQSDVFGSALGGPGETVVTLTFTAMDAQVPYRSPRRTPKPVVQGPQTAVVVGKSGEEIWTDQYGRVKVQFHWDRVGGNDENSSCWVRVAQVWAGDNWGAIHIPRMGQEVIVSFLEGDPDQPIITGRVYNGDNMPPYGLPDNQTQSGIKSRSSKGGSGANYNEIRFEDKMGSEELLIHAEKQQTIEVEADESHWVGHDRTKNVDNDETTTIGNNRTESVGANEDISIGSNRTESVGVNEDITIGANRTESVGANEDITIGANRTTTIGANESTTIGASESHTVGASRTVTVGASETITVGAARTETIGAGLTQTVGGAVTITAAGGMTIVAPGGTKIVDFELCQVGGTIKEGYASKLDFNGVCMEANVAKAELTGSANAAVGLKFEKVGADLGASDALQKTYALVCLSEATGIEMATLKVLM